MGFSCLIKYNDFFCASRITLQSDKRTKPKCVRVVYVMYISSESIAGDKSIIAHTEKKKTHKIPLNIAQ